jgi:hypothetical protein
MAELSLAFDPSSSMSKAIYTLKPFRVEWLAMEPEASEVSKSALEQYEGNGLGKAIPENQAWIEVGGRCYAVGHLARSRFYADGALRELKYERAAYKLVAMVGAIAVKKRLPEAFSLSLGVLLPYGEYPDRQAFELMVKQALSDFSFRGQKYRVKLEQFNCLPEGGGLVMRGSEVETPLPEKDVLVVMVGYRNASYLLMERGQLKYGETVPLGFVRLLERVREGTSGLQLPEMAGPICAAGSRVKEKALLSLVKSQGVERRQEELERVTVAVKEAREQYWMMLGNWLRAQQFPKVDEVILAGGTAHYYQKEIEGLFPRMHCHWVERLEEQVKNLLGEKLWREGWAYRLTDAYAYFFYLQYLFTGVGVLRAETARKGGLG